MARKPERARVLMFASSAERCLNSLVSAVNCVRRLSIWSRFCRSSAIFVCRSASVTSPSEKLVFSAQTRAICSLSATTLSNGCITRALGNLLCSYAASPYDVKLC